SLRTSPRALFLNLPAPTVLSPFPYTTLFRSGRLSLIDEALTPDSSRFWTRESLEDRPAGWKAPVSLDKQYVRDYLKTLDWNREPDRKSTRLNSSHVKISYAVFCLKKKKQKND